MRVTVNGELTETADGTTLSALIEQLGLKPERLAVELNGIITKRSEWPLKVLSDGDKVELVHFVGGGSTT